MTPKTPQFSPESRVVIIGAGPTGLGAGYRLNELGHRNFTIVDRHPYIGGLAASFTDPAGFTWDIGGHVMFSHYEYYDRLFEKLLGDEYSMIERETWVRADKRWVPYPFQNNIRYLSKESALECMAGLVKAQAGGGAAAAVAKAANFDEFMHAAFGDGIVRLFMRPYNFKVWAHPASMMAKDWIGQRVAVVDVQRALRNLILGLDDFGWGPNNRFKFPLRGGTGEFYRRIASSLEDRIQLNRSVSSIDVDQRFVRFDDGSTESYEALLSAMPLDILCRDVLTGRVPDGVRDAAARLRHSGGFMVGIGIRRQGGCPSTRSWMYFADDDCPFYRVTYLSNYSPFMTPDKDTHYSLLCETGYSEHKPVDRATILEDTIRGLENAGLLQPGERDDIVSTWVYDAAYAYPTPTIDRDDALSVVIPWLESRGISSRGRFGMWKYEVANTDHSIMQGVEWANRILLGESETTVGLRYAPNDEGRTLVHHDRPAVAGSGQPRVEVVAHNRQRARS
jgi:protoporphyrinogen oxidase